MKILVTGSTGLLGQALLTSLAPAGEVIGCSRHAPGAGGRSTHVACDVADPSAVAVLAALAPSIVIHAQAVSDVDRCEQEPAEAQRGNADAAKHVAEAAARAGAVLVCMSTDYVFDGLKGSAYDERDEPRPVSVYGRSKVEAERHALRYPRGVVVRTSTLFGPGRINFCDHIVNRLRAGDTVEAFADQVTSPTYTPDLASAVAELGLALHRAPALAGERRVFHAVNAGAVSRVAFAERVAELIGGRKELIRPILMAAQRRPAPRPPYSALTTTELPRAIGRTLRPWDDALQAYLRQHP